jgi:hypothetical membrane protein
MTLANVIRDRARAGVTDAQQLLLVCGVVSSAVYLAADLVCVATYPGYSFRNQVISELSAIGAPTAHLWTAFMPVYGFLFVAFAIGVLRGARGNPVLRRTGWLLVAFTLSAPLWSFVPMHQRGTEFGWTDMGHIAMGAVSVLLITAFIAAGATAFGRQFRSYSMVSAVVVLVAGAASFAYAGRMADNRATPWVGIVERVSIYAFLLWIGVLSTLLVDRAPGSGANLRTGT